MKGFSLWLWIIPLGLVWPLIYFINFLYHRGRLAPDLFKDIVLLIPMSLVAGVLLLLLWGAARTRGQKAGIILGYVLASPVAFVGSLVTGLVIPRKWLALGIVLYGGVPLLIGMFVCFFVAVLFSRIKRA